MSCESNAILQQLATVADTFEVRVSLAAATTAGNVLVGPDSKRVYIAFMAKTADIAFINVQSMFPTKIGYVLGDTVTLIELGIETHKSLVQQGFYGVGDTTTVGLQVLEVYYKGE